MKEFIVKQGKELKIGYTTGTCATASAKAATHALLTGTYLKEVVLQVPAGRTFHIEPHDFQREDSYATCATRKYSGDDPDVTDGMLIYARVEKMVWENKLEEEVEESKVVIDGGIGIGRVTRKGLACSVGMAAINPVPRRMIEEAVREEMKMAGYHGGIKVVISAPEGERIGKKTFNERLGVIGGISILGTSGVVEPMSEDALIDTIKIETNQQDRNKILFAAPGNYGLDFAQGQFGLNMDYAVKYSNYIGEFIDHAIYCGFQKVLIIGHMGKLLKLAAGVMNTHSKVADGRQEIMVAHSAICGVKGAELGLLMEAVTTDEMHEILCKTGCEKAVYESITKKIQFHLDYRTKGEMEIAFIGFSNQYGLILESEKARSFIHRMREEGQLE